MCDISRLGSFRAPWPSRWKGPVRTGFQKAIQIIAPGHDSRIIFPATSPVWIELAERVGFEPTWGAMPPTDFESVPL